MICCSTYICIHWLLLICTLTGDRTHSLGASSNQPNYLARAPFALKISLKFIFCDFFVEHLCFYFIKKILLLFNYSYPHFPPLLFRTLPNPTVHIQSSPFPLLSLSMGPLDMFLDDLSPSLSHYPSLPSLLVTVNFFFISMSLVLFAPLFILFVRFHL